MTGRATLRLALGFAFAAFFVWLTLRQVNFTNLAQVLAGARVDYLVAATSLLCAGYACRIARWRIMLARDNASLRWSDCAGPLLASFAANNVLPFRAGDIMRAIAFNGRLGTTAGAVIATLFVERLLDLLMVILLLGLALWTLELDLSRLPGIGGPVLVAVAGAILVVLLFPGVLKPAIKFLAALAARLPAAGRIQTEIAKVTVTLGHLAGGATMVRLITWSSVAWLCEGGVYWLVAKSLASVAKPAGGWLALPVGTLATLIPSTPGYVGTFDFFAAQAMLVAGNDKIAAAAYALLIHIVLWLPPTLLGGLYLVARPTHGQTSREPLL